MFDRIGSKIKGFAKFTSIVGIFGSIITGIAMIAMSKATAVIGILILVAGSLSSWIGSFFLYGFGELIEKTTEIAENTRPRANDNTYSQEAKAESDDEDANQSSIYERHPDMFKYKELIYMDDSGYGRCQMCFKQGNRKRYKIINRIGTRIIPICEDCHSHMTHE